MVARSERVFANAKARRSASALAVLPLLVSCAGSSGKDQPAQTARIDVVAAPTLNPTEDGRPSPVVVKLYELTSRGDFERARFAELADDKPPLPDLVARTTLVLQPGERVTVEREIDRRARAVGVVAGFQRIDEARWRASIDLARAPTLVLSIDIGAQTVALTEDRDAMRKANRGALARRLAPLWEGIMSLLGGAGAKQ